MSRSRRVFDLAGKFIAGVLLLVSIAAGAHAQVAPRVPQQDVVRLREAFRLAGGMQDELWPGWGRAPFSTILVTPDVEYLIAQPDPSSDFTPLGDTLLGSPVFFRKRQFPTTMAATFPAVKGINTVVIGEAEHTSDRTSTRWVFTVLHEHFHQFVYSQPDYYAGVESLGLARGDKTGMWMLNYPFPYDSARVAERFTAMTHALAEAIVAPEGAPLDHALEVYRGAQRLFRESVGPEEERYFAFQLWQEGVARYTELRAAELAAKTRAPSAEFGALPDFVSFDSVATLIRTRIMNDLGALSLAKSRREVVYSVGAAQAMLLDRVRPGWKVEYLRHPFRLPDPE